MSFVNPQTSSSGFSLLAVFPYVLALLWGVGLFAVIPVYSVPALARLVAVAAVMLSFAGALVFCYCRRPARAGVISPLSVLIGGFFCWAMGSFFWSSAPLQTLVASATLFLLPVGFFTFSVMGRDPRFLRLASCLAGLVFGGLAVWAVVQFLFFPEMLVSDQVRYPFANPNLYAAVLSMGLFYAAANIFNSTSNIVKCCNYALIAFALGAMVLTGGRVVFLASLGFFGLFLWLNRKVFHIEQRRRSVVVGGVFVVAVLVGAVLAQVLSGAVRHSLPVYLAQIITNPLWLIETRTYVWGAVWQIIEDHLWLGTGYGTFYLFYPSYRAIEDTFTAGVMAHNDPLQFWAELGVLGPLFFYAIVIACLLRMARFLNGAPNDRVRIKTTLVFCALGVIVAHSHVSFDFYSAPLLLLFGSALGYWYALTGREAVAVSEDGGACAPKGVRATLSLGLFLVLCAGAFYVWQGALFSSYYTSTARSMLRAGKMEDFRLAVNAANRVGFGINAQAYEFAAMIPFGVLEEERYVVYQKPLLIIQAENMLERSRTLNPRRPESYYYAARLEDMTRNRDKAAMVSDLEAALSLNPTHVPSRLFLADIMAEEHGAAARWTVLEAGRHLLYMFYDPTPYYEALLQAARAGGHDEQIADIVAEQERALRRYGKSIGAER